MTPSDPREHTLPRWAQTLLQDLRRDLNGTETRLRETRVALNEAVAQRDGHFIPHPLLSLTDLDVTSADRTPVPVRSGGLNVNFGGVSFEITPEVHVRPNAQANALNATYSGDLIITTSDGPLTVVTESSTCLRIRSPRSANVLLENVMIEAADPPASTQPPGVHMNGPISVHTGELLGGLSIEEAQELLISTVPLPDESLTYATLYVALTQAQRDGERHISGVLERVRVIGAVVDGLVTAYRSEYEPLREGSVLRAALQQMLPELPLDQVDVAVHTPGLPVDAPLNPWLLLREGAEGNANIALRRALNWTDEFALQAHVILRAYA